MMLAFGNAIARMSSARFPSGAGAPAALDDGLTAGNAIFASTPSSSSAAPGWNLPACSMNDRRSADCWRDRLPGFSKGIVF